MIEITRSMQSFSRRIAVMLAVRLLVILGAGALVSTASPNAGQHAYVFLLAGLGLSALYALWLRQRRQLIWLVLSQVIADQLLFTFVVYLTGGPSSGATSLYGLTCLAAAILLGPKGAWLAVTVGLGSYLALSLSMHEGWFGLEPDPLNSFALQPLLFNGGGVAAVALLASYLAHRLALTGGALERAEERAASAERLALLGRVAAGMAHEIRNPLSSISASVELLAESPQLQEDERMLCEITQREVARLNELVSDMMDLARPRQPEPRALDVSQVVRDVVLLAARQGRGGDVAVRALGIEAPVFGLFDASQLRQLLWNLVKNAIEASAVGDEVQVVLHAHDHAVELRISDRGQGMTARERSQVFDAFFTTRTKGTGLGLAVVRRIVDDHGKVGASLEVESEKGRGTTFLLRFRAAPPPQLG